MATIAAVVEVTFQHDAIRVTWSHLTSTNLDGAPIPPNWMDYSDRSVSVFGTFNGATVTMQAANDDVPTYGTVNDAFGSALTFTVAGIKQQTEVCAWERPLASAAGGSTDLTVVAICRRPRSGQEA